eukprot:scaffold18839_cov61-Cyclotella_meneghiniana.AAC.1
MLFQSVALTALVALANPAHGAGCYPAWSSGSDYFTGSLVSATITKTSTSTASDGTVTETTTSQTKNFKCTSGSESSLSHCPIYDPSNAAQQAAAWSDQGVCSGTAATALTPAPTVKPTPSRWTNAGCPEEWNSMSSYQGGDVVEVDGDVYSCLTSTGVNLWCSDATYKPGDSIHWEMAWKLLGSCDGTIRPTAAPVYTSLTNHNGCPVEFDASATYEAGDKVEMNGLVYECRSWPNSAHCSQAGFEPDGANYRDAWIVLGFCEGTMAPTTSPNFSSLAEVGDGCPKEYVSSSVYETGEQVSVRVNNAESVVYECKSWPNGAYCNSGIDFAPGTDNGKLGWTKKGFCDGTLSPTKAPIAYAPAEKCRWYNGTQAITIELWRDADRSSYVAGSRVRKGTNIYKCKNYPFSLWCKTPVEYEPEVGSAWKDSWTKAGECNGALNPTVSPSASPTGSPSSEPSSEPSSQPSFEPSSMPSEMPSYPVCDASGAHTLGPLEYNTDVGFKVERVGSVPVEEANKAAFSYNMHAADTFDNALFFIDQKEGKIFSYDAATHDTAEVFDMSTSPIPSGLDLSWTYGASSADFHVHTMTQGPDNTVIVVLQSSSLPDGWTEADAKLPAADTYGTEVCDPPQYINDIYRSGTIPACFDSGGGAVTLLNYNVFIVYEIDGTNNGALINPIAFFVAEVNVSPGHMGGGIATMPDGSILYGP